MTRLFILVFMCFGISLSGLSQVDWRSEIGQPDANFFEIQALFYEEFGDQVGTSGSGWKQFKRWEYYWENRVDEFGNFPNPGNTLSEIAQYSLLHPRDKSYVPGTGNWSELGPINLPNNGTGQENGLGRLCAIAFHPSDPNTLYVGAPSGGFWMSSDNGATWAKSITGLTRLGVSSIVVHPTVPSTIYIGTGDRDGSDSPGYGVWRSTDGGATWNPHNTGMGNRTVYELLMDPTNSNNLIAATNGNRIYRSTDGGLNWTFATTSSNVKDIAFKPGDPSTIYASGTTFDVSINGGLTFTQVTAGVPTGAQRIALAVSPNQPNTVYFVAGNGTGLMGVYRSTNSGVSFTLRTNTPNILDYAVNGSGTGSQAWYDLVMAADPADVNTIYVGGINVWKSTDAGANFTATSYWVGPTGGVDGMHADQHVLEFSPFTNTIYAGNDGGIFASNNAGTTWTDLSSGLGIAQVYKIGVAQTVEGTAINGYQDNGTSVYNGGTWSTEIGGDGMECIVDPTDATYMYGALYYGDIRRSTNGGTTFASITGTIPETGGWVTPYKLDPNNANNMYAGFDNVWVNTAVRTGTAWTVKSAFGGTSNLTDLAIAPSNSDVMYTSRGSAAYRFARTTNLSAGTPTWTDLSGSLPSASTPKDIEIDPLDENHLFIAHLNDIYESTNGGASWTNYSGTLPNISLNTIVIDPNSPVKAMYVGMDVGVYYRDNTMADWTVYSTGLTNVEITELEIYNNPNECKSKLYAGTYGQGMWVSDLKDPGNVAPTACFETTTTEICAGGVALFTDLSDFTPTSWTWSVTPATFVFVNATTANSQNPEIQFTAPGNYTIQLTATNANGSDVESKPSYISVGTALVATAFNDDFESYALCGTASDCGTTTCPIASTTWTNLTNGTLDNIDWRIDEGGTPSANTGPTVDFNPGTATGNYAYLEASACAANTGILESACIYLDDDYSFDLGYHMYGATMGELHVDLFTAGVWTNDLAVVTGDVGNSWNVLNIDLTAYTGQTIKLRIRGITGSGFTSDLAIDDIMFTPISLLPAELVEFNATLKDHDRVLVNWKTASQFNVDRFIVQRSPFGIEWEELEIVAAEGSSSELLTYEIWDASPLENTSYYRLLTVDFNGEKAVSEIRTITRSASKDVKIYPNPASDVIRAEGEILANSTVSIHSALGQALIVHESGINTSVREFDIAHLPSGVYFMKIKEANTTETTLKFLVR